MNTPLSRPFLREAVKPIFQSISAKADGQPCCDYVGEDGSGHYVKMVHNGIEYGDIQLICEAYQLLKDAAGLTNEEASKVFEQWNREELDSFLIEITAKVLAYKTPEGESLVSLIRDTAGQVHYQPSFLLVLTFQVLFGSLITSSFPSNPIERDRKVDRHLRPRQWSSRHPDWRGRVCPLPLSHEGRESQGQHTPQGAPKGSSFRQPGAIYSRCQARMPLSSQQMAPRFFFLIFFLLLLPNNRPSTLPRSFRMPRASCSSGKLL